MAAVEVFQDGFAGGGGEVGFSPRISFSHDLTQSDVVLVEHCFSSPPAIDFDFCVFREGFDQESESSPADELFFDGKILPIQIKKRLPPLKKPPTSPLPPPPPPPVKSCSGGTEEKQRTSFWRFKRSSSFSCGGGVGSYGSTLCPIPLLSRSYSTGSTHSGGGKRPANGHRQSLFRYYHPLTHPHRQVYSSRPPSKKGNSGGYVLGFNPLLNLHSTCLFGLCSVFSGGGGRDRTKKKNSNP
ncbi:hypothetical protein M569_03500 [Genlisea aurea]|uniref:Uncharacterized protein n=1 Tax=Genlisea aurea TaxID=192259 RepID=S8CWN9_9LAMI|nr:hypothetical protein M569_03500 [Genlisea aurea]